MILVNLTKENLNHNDVNDQVHVFVEAVYKFLFNLYCNTVEYVVFAY